MKFPEVTVSIKVSGSGDISVAKITATDLKVSLSGSGNIKSNDCTSTNSDIFLSGSGEMNLPVRVRTQI